MQRSLLFLFTVMLASGLFLAKPVMADNIGYLDMEKLLTSYKDFKKIQADAKKRAETYQTFVGEKQKQLEKARSEKKSASELQKLEAKIEDELKAKQQELLASEGDVQRKIMAKVNEFTKLAAKQYNIDVVLDKRAVYLGGFDLTDFVLEKLNK